MRYLIRIGIVQDFIPMEWSAAVRNRRSGEPEATSHHAVTMVQW
jgi:hypothetical protein